jgi:hypothetical protein
MSTVVVYPASWSPTPSTASVMKTPENTDDDPDDPELASSSYSHGTRAPSVPGPPRYRGFTVTT